MPPLCSMPSLTELCFFRVLADPGGIRTARANSSAVTLLSPALSPLEQLRGSTLAEWLAGEAYARAYRGRSFPSCGACPARCQATEALMERHLALRCVAVPDVVRVLLIAESPP